MKRPIIFFCFFFLLAGCGSKIYNLKSHFSISSVPTAPDYSKITSWAALPDLRDAADSVPLQSGLRNEQAFAKADVFFIHPTIFTEKPKNAYQWNADIYDSELTKKIQTSTILNQATIFNGSCKIYAPLYREAHLFSFYTKDLSDAKSALELAYGDVKAAFEYYLKYHNQGRPIVIASHSQGSYHAIRILQEYFDGKDMQKQLVVAYLAGRAIPANSFQNLKPTSNPEETGVWASWCTFGRGFLPDNYEKYYRQAVSINPLLWNASEDFAPKELNHGGVGFKFTMVPQIVDAQNHQGVLWVNRPYVKGSGFVANQNWHRADMNFFYMNIRENVALRISKFLESQQTK